MRRPAVRPACSLAGAISKAQIKKIAELKKMFRITVLMAEQNFNQAIRIADRGYVIVHGHIEFEAKSRQDLADNEMIRKLYLGL